MLMYLSWSGGRGLQWPRVEFFEETLDLRGDIIRAETIGKTGLFNVTMLVLKIGQCRTTEHCSNQGRSNRGRIHEWWMTDDVRQGAWFDVPIMIDLCSSVYPAGDRFAH